MAFLWRRLDFGINSMQFFVKAGGARAIADLHRRTFSQLTSSSDFWTNIKEITEAVDVAVIAEPMAWPRLRGRVRHDLTDDLESHERRVATYWLGASRLYRRRGEASLESLRARLCILAELLDHNRFVHTLLRLSSWSTRERLQGKLGGAILVRGMAEVIRRGAEDVFAKELPEEDEIGFGRYFPGTKRTIYGSERLLDGDRPVVEQYLRSHGLEYGLRLRWYVEGVTEYAALDEVLGRFHAVELVNLRGAVVQQGGKTLAFRDSLRADTRSRTFSFISVDGDRTDTLRAVRAALAAKEVCGVVVVSRPDFEFANFSLQELQTALLELARLVGIPMRQRRLLRAATNVAQSARELWDAAHRLAGKPAGFDKGPEWGRLLIQRAHRQQQRIKLDGSADEERPIIRAIHESVRSVVSDYASVRQRGHLLSEILPIRSEQDQARRPSQCLRGAEV